MDDKGKMMAPEKRNGAVVGIGLAASGEDKTVTVPPPEVERAQIGMFTGTPKKGQLVALAIPVPDQNLVLLGDVYKVKWVRKLKGEIVLEFDRAVHPEREMPDAKEGDE
ncbi:hypothetical protein KAR91_12060 [Candidatus Pacearchaeota archaeon]|nr:hypothetical protein [Candidatus Pacearchaeota archaeon]